MFTEKDINLDKLDLKELKTLREAIAASDETVLKGLINIRIARLEARAINEQFDFERFPIIAEYEKNILANNGITNLQQLIDADLTKLVDETGNFVGKHFIDYCDWARHAFNMSSLRGMSQSKKKEEATQQVVSTAPVYALKKRFDKKA
ncbi:MAG: hypothetical protein IJ193_03295 [Bacilli bacterium]|nr:hypothetical protein [Bacilli bacterium]